MIEPDKSISSSNEALETKATDASSPDSRSHQPSWGTIVAFTAAALSWKTGLIERTLEKAPPDGLVTGSYTPRSIDNTKIVAAVPYAEEMIRTSFRIISSHPACDEARIFLTSGERTIRVDRLSAPPGDGTRGFYEYQNENTLSLSESIFTDLLRSARRLNLNEQDTIIYGALNITRTVCHEAAHATHDRELDAVARDAGLRMEIDPRSLEDEMVARAKHLRVEAEMNRICAIVFPEIGHAQTGSPEFKEQEQILLYGTREEFAALLRDSFGYDDRPRVAQVPGYGQWPITAYNPTLTSPMLDYYEKEISAPIAALRSIPEQDIAASAELAFRFLQQRTISDSTWLSGMSWVAYYQRKIPSDLHIDTAYWNAVTEPRIAQMTDTQLRTRSVLELSRDQAKREEAFLQLSPALDTLSPTRLLLLAAEARRIGIPSLIDSRIGPAFEAHIPTDEAVRLGPLTAFDFVDLEYIPRDATLFTRLSKQLTSESVYGLNERSAAWLLAGAKVHDRNGETARTLEAYYENQTAETPNHLGVASQRVATLDYIQRNLNLDRRPLVEYFERNWEQARGESTPLYEQMEFLRTAAAYVPDYVPEIASFIRERLDRSEEEPYLRKALLVEIAELEREAQAAIDAASVPPAPFSGPNQADPQRGAIP